MKYDRHVAVLTSKVVSGGAILPIQGDGPSSARGYMPSTLWPWWVLGLRPAGSTGSPRNLPVAISSRK